MCVLAQTKPDQRDKKEQCFQSPERARISWGRATRVGGPGEGPYRARGVLYKWALPKFNSGNVRRPAMLNVENNDDRARVLSPQTDGRSTEGRFETLLGYRRGFDLVALRSSRPLISPTPVLGRLRSPPLPLDNAFQPGSLWD